MTAFTEDTLDALFDRALARAALFGDGVPRDESEATNWFAKKDGDAQAAYEIAEMFYGGKQGFDYSSFEAIRWYKIAAGLGHVEALMVLGVTFEMGKMGVTVNNVTAHVYYSLAKAGGREYVDDLLIELEKRMTSEQLETARKMAQAASG